MIGTLTFRLAQVAAFCAVAFVFHHLAERPNLAQPQAIRKVSSLTLRKRNCELYPPYPNTLICQHRWMWHVQPGGWGLMGDLARPAPKGIPRPKPVVPVN